MPTIKKPAAKKPATKRTKKAAEPVQIVSIKGFDSNLRCRGFQFEFGKTFEHDGPVQRCGSGFHACPVEHHPLSVFGYYPPAGARYAEVVQSGATSNDGDKLASASITISYELTIGDLVKRAVEWVFARAKKEKGGQATGDRGAASATGYRGAASATGYRGAASATGVQGAASATGDRGAASATGVQGAASATGYRGAASATGVQGAASATGYQGAASATGYRGAALSSGRLGTVQGTEGNAIFAVERDRNWSIVSVASGIVGRDGIKPLTWYRCEGGKLVEA